MTESFVTIAADDISCLGCLVLCNSLKQTGTEKLISVLVNPTVSCHLKSVLQKSFDKIYFTNDLYVLTDGRNRFDVYGDYERLKCWLLTDFTKCVFLESDVLVVENIDDLFDRMELSAASDPRWPDCFDAGVFVFQPGLKTYKQLIDYSFTNPNADNSFQCLLNMFFCDWNIISMERKIPFTYNCQMNTTFYTHTAALVHFGHSIKAARLGSSVFHMNQPDPSISGANHENWSRLWSKWWKIFNEMVKPAVDNDNALTFKRTGCDYDRDRKCTTQDAEHCHTQGALCSIQESSCPSQDFVDRTQPTSIYFEPARQSISEDEPGQSSCDTFVVSPVEIESPNTDKNDVDKNHMLRWERGEIDYMGEDSFTNILAKLNSTLVVPNDDDQIVNTEE